MSDSQQKPKRKRRWLTYSLRAFLLVVTSACVAFGFWAHSAAKQKAAVEWVKANGGLWYYDFEIDDYGVPFPIKSKAPVRRHPQWARNLLGHDYLSNVVYVSIDIRPCPMTVSM